ncbi:MAG: tRNA (adenosine(37)-N6)-dimethylallyltransferase MiaA [Bacilli bacterium]|nr:tRNA (adenosine(37)-N6)-dimethylallyltransferase MiaA [Bacilli bacterium]
MKLICIVGPTGVGKTKLSIMLAKYLDADILNADSTQVYKELNIATAKISEEEKEGIKHYLLDIKNIDEDYTVFDYQKDGRQVIDEHIKNNKDLIIVGGTGLYIKALLYDYQFNNLDNSNQYEELSNEELYQKLLKLDPNTDIHINNRKRVIKAINYFLANNKPYSEKEKTDKLLYDVSFIGLTCPRDILYKNIDLRVDNMFKQGLEKEALNIYKTGIRTKAVLTPIGYKELFSYFDKEISLDDAKELIKRRSRHYAKRQYTWFLNQMKVTWFNVDFTNFNNTYNEIIKYLNI